MPNLCRCTASRRLCSNSCGECFDDFWLITLSFFDSPHLLQMLHTERTDFTCVPGISGLERWSAPNRISRAIKPFIRFCTDSRGITGLSQTVCGAFLCSCRVAENARQTPGATTSRHSEQPLVRWTWLGPPSRRYSQSHCLQALLYG
jgi:hypothetical protein